MNDIRKKLVALLAAGVSVLCGCGQPETEPQPVFAHADAQSIAEISCGFFGDSIGSRRDTTLRRQDGMWTICISECPGNGCEETVTEIPSDEKLVEQICTILNRYDWQEMKNLPPSEEMALDAATNYLQITLEPFDIWSISDSQELTREALDMWKEIQTLMESAQKT